MITLIKPPIDCTPSELDAFEELAIKGGQVSVLGLRSRIEGAEKLIFIWQKEKCVAIAALKNPLPSYQRKVFHLADMSENRSEYQYEIGYIYADVKGVGNQLMSGILDASENDKIFATTQDTNEVMKYLLLKFGFKKLGNSYFNNTKEYKLGLFGN